MTRVAIVGAAGRMGMALVRCVPRVAGLKLAAAVDRADCPLQGQDAGLLAAAGPMGVMLTADVEAAAKTADVLVDFSAAAALPATLRAAVAHGRAMVVGTTGLDAAQSAVLRESAARIPVLTAPNMSLGMNLLFAMVRQAAAVLGLDYDVEIVEAHHKFKKDAPSGTALRLGERVAEGRGQDFREVAVYGRQGLTGERPRGQIGLHAMRLADVVGDHTVTFGIEGERVEFSHRASSRDAFALGALKAACWLTAGRQPGFYDMQDVLGLK